MTVRDIYIKFEEFADFYNEEFRSLSWPCYFFIINNALLDKLYTSADIFERVQNLLEVLERRFLAEHPFMMFRSEPSLCDIYLFNEFMQLNVVGFDLSDKPRILRYINRVAGLFPEYKKVCSVLFKVIKKHNMKLYIESMKPSL